MRNVFKLESQTDRLVLAIGASTILLLAIGAAQAGTGGAEFATVWTTLTGWMQGTLGKIIAGAMITVGLVAGVARQSIMSFAVGTGMGLGLYASPTIIDNIMTGTLATGADFASSPVVNLLAAI